MRLKDYRIKRNKTEYGPEDGINDINHKFNNKREAWHGGKINGVNCRRLLKSHLQIIKQINLMFIEMTEGIVSVEKLTKYLINMNVY